MQSPPLKTMLALEQALQPERLGRYMTAAEDDKIQVFSLYLWNCQLCEAFYVPLHFCEIICRNALQKGLKARLGDRWYENDVFKGLLDERYRHELAAAIEQERRQHGTDVTTNHVASSLTFGFWQHLATKRFERLLWGEGIRKHFPNAPPHKTREDLYLTLENVRRWRNRIAHHRAIFDKGPMKKFQTTIELIRWVSTDIADYVTSISKVTQVVGARPKMLG